MNDTISAIQGSRRWFDSLRSAVIAIALCTVAAIAVPGTSASAQVTPSGSDTATSAPTLVAHTVKTEYVSSVAPTSAEFARSAKVVSEANAATIRCGQVLTDTISTSWNIWGTSVTILALRSTDYTVWCSGHVYTSSYGIYCHTLSYGFYNFTCLSGNSYGIIGQGRSQVNPWYNQPVMLTYWTGAWHVKKGTGYCRNYMSSNGATNEWCQLNI
jgi:hypothetical protein